VPGNDAEEERSAHANDVDAAARLVGVQGEER